MRKHPSLRLFDLRRVVSRPKTAPRLESESCIFRSSHHIMISIRPPGEYRSVRLAAQALLAQQIAGITHHDSFATGEQFEPTPDDLPSSSCSESCAEDLVVQQLTSLLVQSHPSQRASPSNREKRSTRARARGRSRLLGQLLSSLRAARVSSSVQHHLRSPHLPLTLSQATHAAEVKKRSAEVKAIAEAEQEKKRAADYHGSRAGRGLP